MSGSLYNSERSAGTGFKFPSGPAVQAGVLAAISLATILCIDWAIGASRSKVANSDMVASAPDNCPQGAETFDSQRAACLRRRWSAMRDMNPGPMLPATRCSRTACDPRAVAWWSPSKPTPAAIKRNWRGRINTVRHITRRNAAREAAANF